MSNCSFVDIKDQCYEKRIHFHAECLFQGQVYINGVELGKIQDWYACKIGYVLQLALPYYEELTVRENLFFAAHMRLSKETKVSEKFERVEQIIAEVSIFSHNFLSGLISYGFYS